MNKEQYRKISFRVSCQTFEDLQQKAQEDYLSLSAYIRKQLERELYKGGAIDELQRTT